MEETVKRALGEWRAKLRTPLFADITRTLEVTCYTSGKNNHGSNFIGNLVVLVAIETIAQFLVDYDKEAFDAEVKKAQREIGALFKKPLSNFFTPRQSPNGGSGSDFAVQFLRDYMGQVDQKYADADVAKRLWRFRNPHAHAFYPFVDDTSSLRGSVLWLYRKKRKRVGLRIGKLEKGLKRGKFARKLEKHLAVIADRAGMSWFVSIPQILFVHLRQAVDLYEATVIRDRSVGDIFVKNYTRLSRAYDFATL